MLNCQVPKHQGILAQLSYSELLEIVLLEDHVGNTEPSVKMVAYMIKVNLFL